MDVSFKKKRLHKPAFMTFFSIQNLKYTRLHKLKITAFLCLQHKDTACIKSIPWVSLNSSIRLRSLFRFLHFCTNRMKYLGREVYFTQEVIFSHLCLSSWWFYYYNIFSDIWRKTKRILWSFPHICPLDQFMYQFSDLFPLF